MATTETQVNVKNITYKCSNPEISICFQFYYDSTYKLHPKLALVVLETTHMRYEGTGKQTSITPFFQTVHGTEWLQVQEDNFNKTMKWTWISFHLS